MTFRRRDVLALAPSFLVGLPGFANALAGEMQPLPDGEVSRSSGVEAWLVGPTTSYRHAVLGDDIEATGFVVVRGQQRLTFQLGPDAVFEDRRVRLVRLSGVDRIVALIVKAYHARGAAIAVYSIEPNGIRPLAESEAIGRPNRWLNPIGVADFTGSGERLIAAVVTPHLSGSLRLYRWRSGASVLEEVQRIDGLTNHIIGSRDLDLGHVFAPRWSGVPLIVLPTLDRRKLAVVTSEGGQMRIRKLMPIDQRIVRIEAPRDRFIEVLLESGARRQLELS